MTTKLADSKGKQKTVVQSPTQHAAYPFWLGGAAATLAAGLTHPLDLAKVRMQTSKSQNTFVVLRDSVKADGIVKGAYAGLSASFLRQMTYSLTRFGVYDVLKKHLRSPSDKKQLPTWKLALAAAGAGGMGGVVGNPADIVLVRMTGNSIKPAAKQVNYRNGIDGVLQILKNEGPMSLFRGLGPNTARAVLMNMSQLVTYDTFKDVLLHHTAMFQEGVLLHFTASTLAGLVATTVCSPFDVLKSRIMSASGNQSILGVARRSFRREGFHWMFRGWTPAFIRLAPNTIACFLILEQLRNLVDWQREKIKV